MVTLIRSGLLLLLLLSGCGWNGTPTRINDFVPLTSIEIVPESPAIAASGTIAAQTSTKLKATGNFSGLFTRDVTDQVVWSSSDAASFPYSTGPNKNRVKGGRTGGDASITANVGDVKATYTLTVSNATVSSMVITPAAPSVPKGQTSQFTAIGTFSDATTQDLTFDATWDSSDRAVATVSDDLGSKGLAQTVDVGTSSISATFNGVSGSTTMTVTVPVLQSIALSPANPSILTLSTKKITATGTYSNGTTPDVSSQVTWNSSNTAVATIASDGTVTTLTQGTTTISATLDGVSGATSLRATGGNLASFSVSPIIVTLIKDTTSRIIATGTFNNGGTSVTRDISGLAQWTPANTSLATVSAAGGNLMWLNALGVTPTTQITATAGTLTPFTTTLKVTAPQLQSLVISTTSPELTSVGPLTAGTSARFTATATFIGSGGTTQDVTTLCTWESNNETVATVGKSGLAAGRVTGVAAGTATISATYTNNGITVSAPVPAPVVTVKSLVLQSLTISPATSTVTAGQQVSYTAVASYFGGTSKDVTEDTTWTIDPSESNVALLADKVNQPGQVVAVDRGSATITASFGGKTQTATITVTGP